MARAKKVVAPKPVKVDSRICFAIAYYASEAEAMEADRLGRIAGHTYNGGWFHGMPCGRDKGWDYTDETTGKKLYAVTA